MEREEVLKRTDHYRCRRCHSISPITETVCTKPSCRARLDIYGDIITVTDNTGTAVPQKTTNKNTTVPSKPEKPIKEKKQPRARVPKEKPVVRAEAQTGGTLMTEKMLLTWINTVFLLVYSVMVYCADWTDIRREETYVLICIGILLAGTALAVVFAQKDRPGLHGMMCVLNGALSFAAAGGILVPHNDTVFMFLAMMAAYWWLGAISFVVLSRRRNAEGGAAAFLKKKTLLICLNVVVPVLCGALICLKAGIARMVFTGRFLVVITECLLPLALQVAIAAAGIILLCREQYRLHGILQCATGAVGLLRTLIGLNFVPSLLCSITVAILHIWLGTMSFFGEAPYKATTDSGSGRSRIAFWICLTYFTCIPAGMIVTAVRAFSFYSIDPAARNRVTKILSVVGTLVGVVIYIYAVANYSHCDEALYTSVIGLLTKIVIGDL